MRTVVPLKLLSDSPEARVREPVIVISGTSGAGAGGDGAGGGCVSARACAIGGTIGAVCVCGRVREFSAATIAAPTPPPRTAFSTADVACATCAFTCSWLAASLCWIPLPSRPAVICPIWEAGIGSTRAADPTTLNDSNGFSVTGDPIGRPVR